MKKLSNNVLLMECSNNTDRDILKKELIKLDSVSLERPKRKLPPILLKSVPRHTDDAEIKDIILQQNNLIQLYHPELNIKFT